MFVEVERLRIELPCEGFDLFGVDRLGRAGEALSHLKVVEIEGA